MNFFKLYIGDYQRDTAHLSITEHGAYMLMLQLYYATEKPLPAGKALHRMLRAQEKAEREAIDSVASQFWLMTDAGLVNDRADIEITKAAKQAEANRATAQAREASRKEARQASEQSTNRATTGQRNHSQTPDTKEPPTGVQGGSAPKPPPWSPPAWVPAEQWTAFEAMRKAKGKRAPFTDAARDGIVAELGRLRDAGHDIATVLQASVNNGWSGVFPPKVTPLKPPAANDLDALFRRGAA